MTHTPTDERHFAEFDLAHPEVWVTFEELALWRLGQGFSRFSADAILHHIRWESASPVDDGTGYRLNNSWTPYYARKFREKYPEHAGFFETRVSRADRKALA